MITMYRKDGKEVKVGFDQVKIMEEAGYTHKKPELKKDEEMPDPSKNHAGANANKSGTDQNKK